MHEPAAKNLHNVRFFGVETEPVEVDEEAAAALIGDGKAKEGAATGLETNSENNKKNKKKK